MWNLCAQVLLGIPAKEPEFVALDVAVRQAFAGVDCQTYHHSGLDFQTVTRWWKAGTDHEDLSEHKARQVRKFVEGWTAGRRYGPRGSKP